MAKNLAKVLKADIPRLPLRKAAEELRKKGRGRDTILAHITPREAAKLKAEGGSGTINPETGLPEFEDGFDFGAFFDSTPMAYQPADFSSFEAPSYTPEAITQEPVYQAPTQDYTFLSKPTEGFVQPFQAAQYNYGFQPNIDERSFAGAFPDQYAQATAAEIAQARADVQNALRTKNLALPPDVAAKAYGQFPFETVKSGSARDDELTLQMLNAGRGGDVASINRTVPGATAAAARDIEGYTPEERAAEAERVATEELEGKPIDLTSKVPGAAGIQTPLGTLGLKEALLLGGLGIGGLNYLRSQQQAKQNAQNLQAAYEAARQQIQPAYAQAAQAIPAVYTKAAEGLQQLAAPRRQEASTLYAQTQQGALGPAYQQQLDAARAAAAQSQERAGGVGAAQAQRSIEDTRQRLLASQQSYANSLFGATDPIISNAIAQQLGGQVAGIQTGLQGVTQGAQLGLQGATGAQQLQLQMAQNAGTAATGMLSALAALYSGRAA